MIRFVLYFLLLTLAGCARTQVVYFNDSDKVYTDDARKGVCSSLDFPCVAMSQGKYRQLTTVPVDR